jgi:hypothetical protein
VKTNRQPGAVRIADGLGKPPALGNEEKRKEAAMFKSFDELIRFNRSQLRVWWEASVYRAGGVAVSAAGFQAIYSLLFAIE